VLRRHVVEDIERIVSEGDRSAVVAKTAGDSADLAIEETRRRS
jgi:hypothetical protein